MGSYGLIDMIFKSTSNLTWKDSETLTESWSQPGKMFSIGGFKIGWEWPKSVIFKSLPIIMRAVQKFWTFEGLSGRQVNMGTSTMFPLPCSPSPPGSVLQCQSMEIITILGFFFVTGHFVSSQNVPSRHSFPLPGVVERKRTFVFHF